MKTLEETFEKALLDLVQDFFSFPIVGAKLIKRQLEKKGIALTEQQINELEKKLQNINGDLINFEFDFKLRAE